MLRRRVRRAIFPPTSERWRSSCARTGIRRPRGRRSTRFHRARRLAVRSIRCRGRAHARGTGRWGQHPERDGDGLPLRAQRGETRGRDGAGARERSGLRSLRRAPGHRRPATGGRQSAVRRDRQRLRCRLRLPAGGGAGRLQRRLPGGRPTLVPFSPPGAPESPRPTSTAMVSWTAPTSVCCFPPGPPSSWANDIERTIRVMPFTRAGRGTRRDPHRQGSSRGCPTSPSQGRHRGRARRLGPRRRGGSGRRSRRIRRRTPGAEAVPRRSMRRRRVRRRCRS